MRRGLWLAAGAVLGVAGYRRATRLVDSLVREAAGEAGRSHGPGCAAAGSRPAAASRSAAAGHAAPRGPMVTVARVGAAAGFVRDVRAGVAEYLDLHHQDLARNLGGRSNRTSSG